MVPTRYDVAIRQNADVDFVVQVWADDAHTVVQNITGYTARMIIRPYARSSTIYDTLTVATPPAQGLSINGGGGQVSVHFTAALTVAYTWITGVYDLIIYGPSNVPQQCIAEGDVSVSSRVTV